MKQLKQFTWLQKRAIRHFLQKLRYGVNDRDCWNMDDTIANDVYKKMAYFRDYVELRDNGYPNDFNSKDMWLRELDYMLYFWRIRSDQWNQNSWRAGEYYRYRRGFVSFVKYYDNLWD